VRPGTLVSPCHGRHCYPIRAYRAG
jgi:hypothetical protein